MLIPNYIFIELKRRVSEN